MFQFHPFIIAMSFTKSQVIPEAYRANVMNWFRVPMNIITCAALLCLHVDWISYDKRVVFAACLLLCVMGLFATNALISLSSNDNGLNPSEKKEDLPYSEKDKSKFSEDLEKQKLLEAET